MKLLHRILWSCFRKWAKRQPCTAFVFIRAADGVECDVACAACNRCKNYFFVTHIELEDPKFCPYCGIKFYGTLPISREEMRDIQILP